jgi:hypothetical protein
MTEEQEAEIARLREKLKARKDRPGWAKNCAEIEKRIQEILDGA